MAIDLGHDAQCHPAWVRMTSRSYYLVEANLSHARADLDDPLMKGFVDRLDEIDELAQRWPGFVSQPELPDAGSVYTGLYLLNVSVWDSIEHLRDFTYASEHAELLDRRAEWFLPSDGPAYVLFWFPDGERLTELEVSKRLAHLQAKGPTPYAFTFDQPFSADEAHASAERKP